jgi:hypothetical protein
MALVMQAWLARLLRRERRGVVELFELVAQLAQEERRSNAP